MRVRGEDYWMDELEFQLGRPLTPTGRDCLRSWLRAFAANVKRQADPARVGGHEEGKANGSAKESSFASPETTGREE